MILVVLDSFGVGDLPDAVQYGDKGAATLQHILRHYPSLHLPNLQNLGLYNIDGLPAEYAVPQPHAVYCKSAELSIGKDTLVGHWELMGVVTERPFETFPHGFPASIIENYEKEIGIHVLGNVVSSGTLLLDEFGDAHVATGKPIVYTSADSVFQIAAHEDIIPVEALYQYCLAAKNLFLKNNLRIGRVIARPFKGVSGSYYRTENRKDFLVHAPQNTVLTHLKDHGISTTSIGKIVDIFGGIGITKSVHTGNNAEGINAIIQEGKCQDGFIFANLVDYDMLFGHRRDVVGYAKALEQFDQRLPEIVECLNEEDVLIITADHGCDPAFQGTDHTREYIPILLYGKNYTPGNAGIRASFADVGATILKLFHLPNPFQAKSIL